MTDSLLQPVRPIFRALAVTIVPDAAHLDDDAWRELERIVEDALAARPAAVRRQLRTFIRVLDLLPLARWGRRFTTLDPARRARVLSRLQDGPVLLLRRGLWGLRTLVLMGYYGRPAGAAETGYRASAAGWSAR